ncbi:DUF3732 domain-containing protein [Mycobacterium sp. RTGN8]|uniref:DUF3732 domain-containing protein n=1 Tax=Mycobacterium sp. RTGN8 TaxID=3016520 RepID=UPI0029C6FE93|nr:DUF3732 domain-containing protein [Mycobacterium sp. RTGN8]
MQLLALALYRHGGLGRRDVRFNPGELNIVTGESKTGKSALLTITEFCLGRDDYLAPAGPIADHVAWYGSLWQLTEASDGPRAFVGRPAPPKGQQSTELAMLEFGGGTMDLFDFGDLTVNADSASVRRQIGRRIGIDENIIEPRGGGVGQTPFEAHLGHAAWLCLQDQGEIANQNLLFHRQAEWAVAQHLKDTIPYFLGAVPVDAAAKKAALRDANRAQRRAEAALKTAEEEAEAVQANLRGLLAEAYTAGLTAEHDLTESTQIIGALHAAARDQLDGGRGEGATAAADAGEGSVELQDRRRRLLRQRSELRSQLGSVMDDRALLLDRAESERDFEGAVELHAGRLTSLDLLPAIGDGAESANSECPMCGSGLEQPDPTVAALAERLQTLRDDLTLLGAAPESRRRVLIALESAADRVRQDLVAVEAAVAALDSADQTARAQREADAARNYTRGRIAALLGVITDSSGGSLERLRRNLEMANERVTQLLSELNPDEDREQLLSRLNIVGHTMTALARRLELEHVENGVRLDLANLTVVTDTSDGPLPLQRIGSAANWIGYHLATHLALHRFFVENDRPVPRFLMIDQPTQAFYPSDTAKNDGIIGDADHAAVLAMFIVMRDVVESLAPRMQIIVSDHADLVDEAWFQDAVRHRWRGGVRLIPNEWLEDEILTTPPDER